MFGINSIYPNPESRDILLEILLKICESDIVAAMDAFIFGLITLNYDLQTHVVLIMLTIKRLKESTN